MKRTAKASGLLAAALLLASGTATAQQTGTWAGAGKLTSPVKFEAIPGSSVKRVILTEKANQRLGIKADAKVGEANVPHTQLVGGLVVTAPAAMATLASAASQGSATPVTASMPSGTAGGELLVMVPMSLGEANRLAQDRPARVRALTKGSPDAIATPTKLPVIGDEKRTMVTLHYALQGTSHGLEHMQRVELVMELSDHMAPRKVVPVSAVYFDGSGKPWVYVQTAPLTYERKPVVLERIAGNLAILTDAPPAGTPIVNVGPALLFGAERYGK